MEYVYVPILGFCDHQLISLSKQDQQNREESRDNKGMSELLLKKLNYKMKVKLAVFGVV